MERDGVEKIEEDKEPVKKNIERFSFSSSNEYVERYCSKL